MDPSLINGHSNYRLFQASQNIKPIIGFRLYD